MSFNLSSALDFSHLSSQRCAILFGSREIEAKVEEKGSFTSIAGTTVPELTISFIVRGNGAQERYVLLEHEARQNGFLFKGDDSATTERWKLQDAMFQWCARSGGQDHYFKAHWRVRLAEG